MRRPTLHDVARAAGVSHMTVSRVARGQRVVAPATVVRVRAAIRKLGYRPDPFLSALAAYRSGQGGGHHATLAFLDCDRSGYSQVVLRGVREEARLLGYAVDRFRLEEKKEGQGRLSRLLFNRGVTGLLFGPSDGPWNLEGWEWPHFAAVSLGVLSHTPALHAVAMDYFQGAMTACERLREKGCRRLGLAVDPRLEARTGHRWTGGFLAWHGGGSRPALFRGDIGREREIREWAARARLDGLLTIHPHVERLLRPAGIRTAFLNSVSGPHRTPHLALNPEEIGAEGIRLLHHLLLRHEVGLAARPKVMLLPGTWIDPAVAEAG